MLLVSLLHSLIALVTFVQLSLADEPGELKIEVVKAVSDAECKIKSRNGDTISAHYEGQLLDGTVFDSSYERHPISFQLGQRQVIQGWEKGLLDMCIGEKRKLTIPYNLAYGERDLGIIPPKSTLVFTTELMEISGSEYIVDEL